MIFECQSVMTKKHITIFSFIGVIIFYSILISISDFEEFSNNLNLIKMEFIPIILGLHFVVMFIRTIRQKILFDSLDVQLSFKEHFLIHFSGLALIMTPGGLGQTVKAYYLKEKRNIQYSKSVSITLVERFYDLTSIIPVLFVISFFVDSIEIKTISLIISILLLIVVILIKNKKIFTFMISIVPKVSIFKNIKENSEDLYAILGKLTFGKTFLLSLGIGTASWIVASIAFYFSFLAFNLNISFSETTIMSLVPITIGALSFLPGGIIIIEVTMLGFLINHGIDNSLSSALVLFTRITSIWFLTIIGIMATKLVHSNMKQIK